jgi:5'-phosphate synthase pdxT subunit
MVTGARPSAAAGADPAGAAGPDGPPAVGVLALQGAYAPHVAAFARLGVRAREVRAPEHLAGLTHLVLPGAESTTVRHLVDLFGLAAPLVAAWRAGSLALFGTCAGAILLGRAGAGESVPERFALLDAVVERNAYGRQRDSFRGCVALAGEPDLEGFFIRAPRVTAVGPGARVLGRLDGEPVLVAGPGILAATFHAELCGDDRLHARFLALAPRSSRRGEVDREPDGVCGVQALEEA